MQEQVPPAVQFIRWYTLGFKRVHSASFALLQTMEETLTLLEVGYFLTSFEIIENCCFSP